MKFIKHTVGTRVIDGKPTPISRNFFIYAAKKDWFGKMHAEFTRAQRKKAKRKWKKAQAEENKS